MRVTAAFALVLLFFVPFALAEPPAKPGGFFPIIPWIVQGPAMVSVDDGSAAPCVENTLATIYAWVENSQANFQLTLGGGCGVPATIFHGTGDIWTGWVLSDYAPTHPTAGWLDGFEHDGVVEMDMSQTLPTGESIRVVVDDFTIVF